MDPDGRTPVSLQALRPSCVLFLLLAASACQASGRGTGATVSPSVSRSGEPYDPVTMDPATVDSAYPARMAEIAFKSGGERLNGLLYVAAGAGPHPAVLVLHGNPGNERNLDLAQAVRRAGYTALFFDYRGNWGSGGTFSRTHALDDVRAALAWVRSGAIARQFRIDSTRVALVGHSMGGWLALMTAAADPRVMCVAALDSRNVGAYGRQLRQDRSADSALTAADDSLTAPGAPYRSEAGGAGLVAEMKANAEGWDVTAHARALSDRTTLLVSAVFKADQDSLVAALERVGARRVTALAWHTDHSFSDRRVALVRTVVGWLQSSCAL
jgi:pimeloyl-ACP methyl ester carboxylesterase